MKKSKGSGNTNNFNNCNNKNITLNVYLNEHCKDAMNLTDFILTGGAILNLWVIPIMLFVGFLTPWPYNYWRLKKFGINCH